MKNKFLVYSLVTSVLLCSHVSADSTQYGGSQLQLNNQIIGIMNTSSQSSAYYQNDKNPTKSQTTNLNYNTKMPTKTSTYTTKPVLNNTFNNSLNTEKNISQKDLQIEGKVERTQKDSLYQNQSPAELQMLVNRIGKEIMRANGITTSITFKYNENNAANANTNFSGTIKVYKGLIKYCEDEAELAYVIGHEIGHATSHHVAKGIALGATGGIASTAATIAVEKATTNKWASLGVGAATEILTGLGEKKASRVMEKNADFLGIDYIVKAGYNPLAAIAIMNKIGENYMDFWQDHPSTDKRIVMMYDYIKEKYPNYLADGYDSVFYDQALEDYIYNKAYYQKLSKNYK